MFIVICNIVLLLDTYEEAMKHLNKAVEASELSSTDVEKTRKRRRVKKQIFDNSQPLPKQKAIEKPPCPPKKNPPIYTSSSSSENELDYDEQPAGLPDWEQNGRAELSCKKKVAFNENLFI